MVDRRLAQYRRLCHNNFSLTGEATIMRQRTTRILAVMAGCVLASWSATAVAQQKPVTLEFFSWSIFRLTAPTGEIILTNPFVKNPDSPVKVADFPKVDGIVVADGHGDEVGSTDEIAIATGAKIITTYEMYNVWFQPRNVPLPQVLRSEPGDSNMIGSVKIRNVGSVHGSGTSEKTDGGPAMGFFITYTNGLTVYFAGSTDTTLDMTMWGKRFKPDVAILCLSGGRDPQDLVEQARLLSTDNPNLHTVIPHHVRIPTPAGTPSAGDLEAAFKASGLPITVIKPEFNKVYELKKS
jgi:L-ascorbate metabolism protein UlaG (beta-lactamase superfamily)